VPPATKKRASGGLEACLRRPKTFFEKKVSGLPKNFGGGLDVIYWKTPFSKAFREKIKHTDIYIKKRSFSRTLFV